jgi:hypothetical protein
MERDRFTSPRPFEKPDLARQTTPTLNDKFVKTE